MSGQQVPDEAGGWDYDPVERTPEERSELRERESGDSQAILSRLVPKITIEDGSLIIRTRK